jgi:hypothetical protein
MKFKVVSVVAVATGLLALSIWGPVMADTMMQKAGKAIQYTTRKDTENLSQVTHEAIGAKSVHSNRTGMNAHTKYVLTPSGNKYRIVHHHHHHHHMM